MEEQYYAKVGVLTMIVIFHSIFGISSILCIVFYSLGIHSSIVDILSLCNVMSMILYNKCVAIDIYETVRDGYDDIPEIAKDNYLRKSIVSIFKNTDFRHQEDYTKLRLDILSNMSPFIDTDCEISLKKFFTRKLHYIVINILICTVLIIKYKYKHLLPVILGWIFFIFPL